MSKGSVEIEASARRWRCPACGGGSCRCRGCGERYAISASLTCGTPLHYGRLPELVCRCGAVLADGFARRRDGARLKLLCEVEVPRAGLIGRLRAREQGRTRFAWLSRGTRRAPSLGRQRDGSVGGRATESLVAGDAATSRT